MAKQSRKHERAVLVGEAVLKFAATNPQFAEMLRNILNASISGKQERELLSLQGEEPRASDLPTREAQRAAFFHLGPDFMLGQ